MLSSYFSTFACILLKRRNQEHNLLVTIIISIFCPNEEISWQIFAGKQITTKFNSKWIMVNIVMYLALYRIGALSCHYHIFPLLFWPRTHFSDNRERKTDKLFPEKENAWLHLNCNLQWNRLTFFYFSFLILDFFWAYIVNSSLLDI